MMKLSNMEGLPDEGQKVDRSNVDFIADGLVEYVGLISANSVDGFVVPNTQFGVPYVEFTASQQTVGTPAILKGSE